MVMIMENLRYYIVRANDEGLLKWMPDKHACICFTGPVREND